jgi:hypothetical protein
MKLLKFFAIVFFLAGLGTFNLAQSGTLNQKAGFSLTLPDGWVEIPKETLVQYEDTLAELAPNAQKQHFDYGFQMDGSKGWFTYPYVLIQVGNNGRIPADRFEKLPPISAEKMNDLKDKLSTVMSHIEIGKLVYDSENRMMWMRIELNVRDVGPVAGLSAIIPTEKGTIQVNAYCLKEDYPTYEPVFRSLAKSMILDADLAYKTKWSDGLPSVLRRINWEQVGQSALIGGIIGGIAFLMRRKKRKNIP